MEKLVFAIRRGIDLNQGVLSIWEKWLMVIRILTTKVLA